MLLSDNPVVSDQERFQLVIRYAQGAQELVARTQDEEAQEYLSHLFTWGYVAAFRPAKGPDSLIYQSLGPIAPGRFQDTDQSMAVLPAYNSDAQLGAIIEGTIACHSTRLASYDSEKNAMLLLADKADTDIVGGGLLLHEAGHAKLAFLRGEIGKEGFADGVSTELLREEGRLHYLNARLWRKWGGQEYDAVLQKALYRIGKMAKGKRGYANFEQDDKWSVVFDQLFGIAPTEKARQTRLKLFVLYANLEWVDRQKWSIPLDHMRGEVFRAYSQHVGRL